MYFSIHWERVQSRKNIIQVRVTFLDEQGKYHRETKYYEEWIGVCTNNIERVVDSLKQNFPGHNVVYRQIGQAKKILPYFEDRLAKNKLDYRSKPFYKVYTTASHKNVGRFFNRYKIGFYDPEDWLVRIYIDLCIRYETHAFYYKWYEIVDDNNSLVDSFRMVPDRRDQPDWTVAAFDLEAVPLKGNHVPMGHFESDRIVMLSVYKWNRRQGIRKWLLYLLPNPSCDPLPQQEYEAFATESEMLIRFHELLDDAQVLTGYNINSFDFPCIFARLVWLKLNDLLKRYTSAKVGSDVVVKFDDKIIVDLYTYFKTFSGYNLPSYKLDDVARTKLKGETKLQVKSTGIWSWYRNDSSKLLEEDDVQRCFDELKPKTVSKASEFGTFRTYLEYCLKDSELVYRLFEKEFVLSFLVERANFTALNAVQVLHLGNSRYLLELFKTYGTRLGYFINPHFFGNVDYSARYKSLFCSGKQTYQGALNFCTPERVYEDVSAMDFTSMYPSALFSSNLCYGTCTIMTREEWSSSWKDDERLTAIPYRQHSSADFAQTVPTTDRFSYPTVNENDDKYVILVNTRTEAFLPQIVKHFIQMRQHHQREWKRTKEVYHYNIQLGIKILINSLYGVMANKDSPLMYISIAMTIVTLSRYQLLGSYHYLKNRGYDVCYADTDSLMVHEWPKDDCDEVNAFLNIPGVELKYEQRMKRLLVLSKKRYVYEKSADGVIVTNGFQKKTNGLVKFMTEKILNSVWNAVFGLTTKDDVEYCSSSACSSSSRGWIVWVDTILEANYMCRDPKKYSIYRRIKNLDEYKSINCPSVKYLKKYPDRIQDHVEFTYSAADVAACEASNWVVDVEDCRWVNYEQLFITQKKIFCTLLNMAFWHLPDPTKSADMVLNTLHWKRFVHAELLHWHATKRRLVLFVEPGLKYTFHINDYSTIKRRPGRKRKLEV